MRLSDLAKQNLGKLYLAGYTGINRNATGLLTLYGNSIKQVQEKSKAFEFLGTNVIFL